MIARAAAVVAAGTLVAGVASAADLYFNGFETDTSGWTAFGGGFNATRVASGTNGITSATGSFHAESSASGSAGNWGGYNFGAGNAVPTAFQAYTTSIAVYLNVQAGFANNSRFDFSSAINNSGGTYLQDFIFNAGFYNSADVTGPGAGTNRFVISASNNSQPGSAYAKNPARSPIAIGTTGWYTFQHSFYQSGGFLYSDMSIYDASQALVNTWTIGGVHAIAGVGGNRYGWFDYNQLSTLAFDDARLTLDNQVIPLPSAGGLAALGLVVVASRRRAR